MDVRRPIVLALLVCFIASVSYATGQTERTRPTEVVDVRWFHAGPYDPDAQGPWLDNMNSILSAEGINVVYESVPFAQFNDKQLAMALARDTPDTGPLNMMIATSMFRQGYFHPLDDYVATTTAFDYDNDLLPGPWGNSKHDGRIYGIPWQGDARLLFINETAFERAGVPLPPETNFLTMGWDGFLDLAERLTIDVSGDGRIDQYGFAFVGGEHNHFIHDAGDLWHQIGAEMVNELGTEARVNREPFVETIQLYVDLYDKGVVPPDVLNYMSYADVRSMFASDSVAMWIVGPWEVSILPTVNPEIRFQVTDLPLHKEGHKASSGGGWHLAIYSAARQKDAAWRVIEVMTAEIEPWSFTMYKPAMAQEPWSGPAYRLFVEYLPYTRSPTYAFDQLDEGWKTVFQEIQAAIIGQKSVRRAMDDAAANLNRLLR